MLEAVPCRVARVARRSDTNAPVWLLPVKSGWLTPWGFGPRYEMTEETE